MKDIKVQIMTRPSEVLDTEDFDEYVALCEKHGITARNTVPSGYWEPDAYERRVIGTVFSRVIKLTEYKESIPLRVLTELDKVKKDDKFYYILTPESDPDPFLVESDREYTWSVVTNPFTVIARWGTHLPDMPEMEKRAIELTKIRLFEYVQKLQTALHQINSDLDAQARAVLYGKEPQNITF